MHISVDQFNARIETKANWQKSRRKDEKQNGKEAIQTEKDDKTRLTTLNVSSINNKKQVLERYLKTNRVKIAVITETHLQEGDHKEIHIKGYKLASSCSRKQGQQKGR